MTFSEVDIYGDYLRKTFSESRHRWEKCLLLSIDIVILYNPKVTLFSAVSSFFVAPFFICYFVSFFCLACLCCSYYMDTDIDGNDIYRHFFSSWTELTY